MTHTHTPRACGQTNMSIRNNVPNVGSGIVGDPSAPAMLQPFPPAHQLATFAPSKADILGTLEFFFGKPGQPEKLTDFSDHHAATYHFPDAFLGKNVYLRDTLNNLIMQSPQNWQTSTALPFLRIEGVTVAWDEIHFDVRLLQRVPYEGASRMQTSIKRSHRDRVVRCAARPLERLEPVDVVALLQGCSFPHVSSLVSHRAVAASP